MFPAFTATTAQRPREVTPMWKLAYQIREGGTVALSVMFGFSGMFFAVWLAREWQSYGPGVTLKRFYRSPTNKTAIAWLSVSLGAGLKNASAYVLIRDAVDGSAVAALGAALLHATATFVELWGMVCLMRCLIGPDWPPRSWVYMALSAAVVTALVLAG